MFDKLEEMLIMGTITNEDLRQYLQNVQKIQGLKEEMTTARQRGNTGIENFQVGGRVVPYSFVRDRMDSQLAFFGGIQELGRKIADSEYPKLRELAQQRQNFRPRRTNQ